MYLKCKGIYSRTDLKHPNAMQIFPIQYSEDRRSTSMGCGCASDSVSSSSVSP
jgi:hypothetical protein